MKKIVSAVFLAALLLLQVIAVSALASDDSRREWQDAKSRSLELQKKHNDAKIKYAGDKSPENDKAVVDTGKDVLNAALDEVQAWLEWKRAEAGENTEIPDNLKETIKSDVDANLAKVDALRTDVESIQNQLGLGLVFLKMIGKYGELLTDVARDTGKVFVFKGNKLLDTADDYEAKLRAEADEISGNSAIMAKLDSAKNSLEEARSNVNKAESSYNMVVLPGTPMIKFAEGNDYIRVARTNLASATMDLQAAYNLMVTRGV